MRLLSKRLPADFNLFLAGDTHEGTILKHEEGIAQLLDMLESEYEGCKTNYMAHGGDEIEAILVDDKRYNVESVDHNIPTPLKQAERVITTFKQVRKKILFWLLGNHTWKLLKYGNITRDVICKELEVPYGTFSTKFTVLDRKGEPRFKFFYMHGRKNIQSHAGDPVQRKTNMQIILKRHLYLKAGDAILMAKAHAHKLIVLKPTKSLYLYDDGKNIKQGYTKQIPESRYISPELRWYACTGSFLKLYGDNGVTGYAEMGEYDPVELGFIIVRVRNYKVQGVDEIYL